MKCLVTGATGFLGSHLVRGLLLEGHQVVVLKRSFSNTDRIADLLDSVRWFDLDRCGVEDPFRDGDEKVDFVVHCATCYGRAGESISELVEADLAFPLRLLDVAAQAGVRVFFNTDTVLPKDTNAYALAKSQFRDWAIHYGEQSKIGVVNVRFDHFFGPGDDPSKFTTFVIEGCLSNRKELELTAGEQQRDFIYVDDVISAYLILLREAGARCPGYSEYDIGTGRPVSVRDFVKTVHRLSCSNTHLNFGALPYRPHEPMRVQLDIAPISALGWKPRYGIAEGIRATIAVLSPQIDSRTGR